VTSEELLHYDHRANDLPIAIARFSLVYDPWEAVIPGRPIRIHHSIAKVRAMLGYDPQHDVFRSIRDGRSSGGPAVP
jgi:nucleoside-diphosphate-sugar epimerase